MNERQITRSIISFAIITLIVIVVFNYIRINNIKDLKRNYKVTVGYFYKYYEVADSGRPVVRYFYYVKGVRYYREVYTNNNYKYCRSISFDCSNIRFWVLYSPEDPRKSLINLKMEIQGMEDPPFPKNLDDFE
ncbi:MAG: hypothetical protein JW922_00010 [Paludibacteraceae bacterium]|nr:hypothetical protein [Paludibacteraceae bacterium]